MDAEEQQKEQKRIELAKAFNASAVEVSPSELVRFCWPKMPGVNNEADFIDSGINLNDGKPFGSAGSRAVKRSGDSGGGDTGGDPWIDKDRRKFDDKKHKLGADGFPEKTDKGYFKSKSLVERAKEKIESSFPGKESGSQQAAGPSVESSENLPEVMTFERAGETWAAFAEFLAKKYKGDEAGFQEIDGVSEKESVSTGLSALFRFFGIPPFTAFLLTLVGVSGWGFRVFWKKKKNKEVKKDGNNDSVNGSRAKAGSNNQTEQAKPAEGEAYRVGGLD